MADKRQRRAREIQREKGIPYTAALREADEEWAERQAAAASEASDRSETAAE